MEAATLPDQETSQDGAPVEAGAEATRTVDHLFEYSQFVHAGAGAEECEHREDGKCQESGHFHAWVCLPNSIQHKDILDKQRAASARRKRALRDAGDGQRPASDAYVTLEAELDDLLAGERKVLLEAIAAENVRKQLGEFVLDLREEERFEHYDQDMQEYRRLALLKEEERPTEEFQALDEAMTAFGNAVQERVDGTRQREVERMLTLPDEQVRQIVRESRIDGDAGDYGVDAYYLWMGFVCTRRPPESRSSKRCFDSLDDFRNGPPEAIRAIDDALRNLEGRLSRGDVAGN